MKIIGLTGGIATGKSTVSKMLVERGFEVIDADAVVKELQVAGSPLLTEITKAFGSTTLGEDGNLKRAELAKIIFMDEEARNELNAIVHPVVRAEFERRIARSQAEILFLDVPLLFETGFSDMTDANLVINASESTQYKRLKQRDGLTRNEIYARIRSQMSLSEKTEWADYVIDNDGDFRELEEQVEKFLGGMTNERDSHSGSTVVQD